MTENQRKDEIVAIYAREQTVEKCKEARQGSITMTDWITELLERGLKATASGNK